MKCPLTEVCKHYQPDSKCCNDESEARRFCGKYREFLLHQKYLMEKIRNRAM